jgi:hypothetical protein
VNLLEKIWPSEGTHCLCEYQAPTRFESTADSLTFDIQNKSPCPDFSGDTALLAEDNGAVDLARRSRNLATSRSKAGLIEANGRFGSFAPLFTPLSIMSGLPPTADVFGFVRVPWKHEKSQYQERSIGGRIRTVQNTACDPSTSRTGCAPDSKVERKVKYNQM